MPQVVIENPILNSPYQEPTRHFKFTEDGITDEVAEQRRASSYFVPIPQPCKRSKQLAFNEWTQDRIEENTFINQIRERVTIWRRGGHQGITRTTGRLLEYWQRPERERKLFFCQIEALETTIYLTEVARKYGDAWIDNKLREANDASNPLLFRSAFKMATGSGKTVVMAMLIAWQALNKIANTQDARFSDTFLIVTPGITIRDRLQVLKPNDPRNYYRALDVGPFKGESSPFTETPDQMVRRVCRELGSKKNLIVINDEAHHCYRRKPDAEEETLTGDERQEARQREEEARVWISGLEAVKAKLGIKVVYDLSATPFFLRGSGYSEGTLFPWVVSDFSLIDAIESGIVKVPRVPVSDDRMKDELPTYRNIWPLFREHLPKKGRKEEAIGGEPKLPKELEGALHSLYSNYERNYQQWERNAEARARGSTPPVFIVVCNNTNVSKMVFDYIAGWEKTLKNGSNVPVPGKLALFSNVEGDRWSARPNTILVDSSQLESGEAMSAEFKHIAAGEIQKFKDEYRLCFPGRDPEDLTDEDLLREVMNTVGKPGRLGEQIKCVVSVSMLTEGWDANTATHILGVRAFGTQLLCEQVVGRGLRRTSYATNAQGMFDPQYAEVYGVPFSFILSAGSAVDPKPGPMPTRVRAVEDRIACEITFPRVMGYRYDLSGEKLTATFNADSRLALSTADLPSKTEMQSIIGESSLHKLYGLDEGATRPWLFPQLLNIARQWRKECVTCKDNAFPQMLLITEFAHDAADHIYRAIVTSSGGDKTLKPILRPYDTVGSTRYADFDTTRSVYSTDPTKCHISHVALDSHWEAKLAETLEEMDDVICYVKNQSLGFTIPCTLEGQEHNYIPDYIVRLRIPSPFPYPHSGGMAGREGEGKGEADNILNLILEVSGEARKDKAAKTATARNFWVPSINNRGGFGRWAYLEVTDPWDARSTIRAFEQGQVADKGAP